MNAKRSHGLKVGDRVRATIELMGDDHCSREWVLPPGALGHVDMILDGDLHCAFPCGTTDDGADACIINVFTPGCIGVEIIKVED